MYKVTLELNIDPYDYEELEFDLEDVVINELFDLCRTDILSACNVEEVK